MVGLVDLRKKKKTMGVLRDNVILEFSRKKNRGF